MNETTRDLICGTIGGISGKIVEYPLDTVKVRMQISKEAKVSPWKVIKHITRHEGFYGFYAGVVAPIYGAAFENAASFAGYGFATSTFRKHIMGLQASDTNTLLPIHGVFMCGAFSGIAAGMLHVTSMIANFPPMLRSIYYICFFGCFVCVYQS